MVFPKNNSDNTVTQVKREIIPVIIAEAIFNSLLRYGVAVFLKPIYEKEDLNMEKKPQNPKTPKPREVVKDVKIVMFNK